MTGFDKFMIVLGFSILLLVPFVGIWSGAIDEFFTCEHVSESSALLQSETSPNTLREYLVGKPFIARHCVTRDPSTRAILIIFGSIWLAAVSVAYLLFSLSLAVMNLGKFLYQYRRLVLRKEPNHE